MKQTFILLTFILSFLENTNGQDVFLHIFPGNIFQLESDYSLTLIATETYSNTIETIADIAIAPDNYFYGVTLSGAIISINIPTGETTVVANFPGGDNFNSLTCSNEFDLYTLTGLGNLYKYNLLTDTVILVDNIGESTPGDITFYKGNLIFQSTEDGNIKAYNINTHSVTTILCRQAPLSDEAELWGIANIFEDCDSEIILSTDDAGNLYLLNIDQDTIEHLHYYDTLSQAYPIYGMASISEHNSSTCDHTFIDLQCNSSTNHVDHESNLTIFPNPTTSSFNIETSEVINKVLVLDHTGKLLKSISGNHRFHDISDLNCGIYYLQIITAKGRHVEKVVLSSR